MSRWLPISAFLALVACGDEADTSGDSDPLVETDADSDADADSDPDADADADTDATGDTDAGGDTDADPPATAWATDVYFTEYYGWPYEFVSASSVAISADGNRIAFGDPYNEWGKLAIFARTDLGWELEAELSEGTNYYSDYAYSLSFSADGTRLAVGDPGDRSVDSDPENQTGLPDIGAVKVYKRTGSTWAFEAYLKADVVDGWDLFGKALALSADGTTLAVAAPGEDSFGDDPTDDSATASGAAYVFTRSDSAWTQAAMLKVPTGAASESLGFGASLAASSDGKAIVVGATQAGGTGMAYRFERPSGGWGSAVPTQRSLSSRVGSESASYGIQDDFGASVAISEDGNRIVVGAPGEDGSGTGVVGTAADEGASASGAAYVFDCTDSGCTRTAYLKPLSTDADDRFGTAVAISGDGVRVAVGAPGDDSNASGVGGDPTNNTFVDTGAVYSYRLDAAWTSEAYFKGWDAPASAMGSCLALDGDGTWLVTAGVGRDWSAAFLYARE